MRILIADDDPVTSHRLKVLAEGWGYEVVLTSDGPSTVRALDEASAPRLVLLDWVMPGMAGLQICQMLRQRDDGKGIYVIMLTARHAHEDMVAGFDAGVDDYLVKPFDADELRGRLKAGARIVELMASIKTLKGMLPICGYCKSIRDDSNYWHQLESYVSEHSDAEFSHGICPDCLTKARLEVG